MARYGATIERLNSCKARFARAITAKHDNLCVLGLSQIAIMENSFENKAIPLFRAKLPKGNARFFSTQHSRLAY